MDSGLFMHNEPNSREKRRSGVERIGQPRCGGTAKEPQPEGNRPGRGSALARFARALHTAIKKGRGAHTFSPREKVPRRGG